MLDASCSRSDGDSVELLDSFPLRWCGSTIRTVLVFLLELGLLTDPLRLRELCLLIGVRCVPSAFARSSIPSMRLISVTSRISDRGRALAWWDSSSARVQFGRVCVFLRAAISKQQCDRPGHSNRPIPASRSQLELRSL